MRHNGCGLWRAHRIPRTSLIWGEREERAHGAPRHMVRGITDMNTQTFILLSATIVIPAEHDSPWGRCCE